MKNRGFTLIELLVVVAIIAILAAILMPVFSQAREKARQATCLSNHKQIGLAIMAYAQDYDEFLPPSNYRPAGFTSNWTWQLFVEPYVKSGFPNPISASQNRRISVFVCPSWDRTFSTATAGADLSQWPAWMYTRPSSSYAGNYYVMGSFDALLPVALRRLPSSLAQIQIPAQTVLVAEGLGTCVWTPGDDTGPPYPHSAYRDCSYNYVYGRDRHSEGANFIFNDGHAKWFKSPSPSFRRTGPTFAGIVPTRSTGNIAYRRSLSPGAAGWFRED